MARAAALISSAFRVDTAIRLFIFSSASLRIFSIFACVSTTNKSLYLLDTIEELGWVTRMYERRCPY